DWRGYQLRLADGADRGDGREGRGGDHLSRRYRRRGEDRRAHPGVRGSFPVTVRRRRARLHRRRYFAVLDASAHCESTCDVEGQACRGVSKKTRQSTIVRHASMSRDLAQTPGRKSAAFRAYREYPHRTIAII